MSTAAASRRILVVGSGAIGLRTSLELLRSNQAQVVLRSPVLPTDASVCSQGAGGLWMPFHCADSRVDRWAQETFEELYPMAVDEADTNVELVPCVGLCRDLVKDRPSWSREARLEFQHMTVEMLEWQNSVHQLRIPSQSTLLENGYTHANLWKSPIVDPPKLLLHMMQQVQEHANAVDVNSETGVYYKSMNELFQDASDLGCDTVINCTGLGARQLANDNDLVGARGILLHFDRKTVKRTFLDGINDTAMFAESGSWGDEEYPAYVIPRGDLMVVGGSYQEGKTESEISDAERRQLLKSATRLGIDVDATPPVSEWVGFRPARRGSTACYVDSAVQNDNGVKLLHAYGHGGSGWTLLTGIAKETTKLALEM